MFNSRPLSGSAGHVWAYLTGSEKGAEEYYLGRGEAVAEVFGKGAERLGLDRMDAQTFANLAKGLSPDGSERLIQTQNGKHVIGIDVNASADKSVSVAMIGATPAQRDMIQSCWDEAFDASLEYLQEHARLCRVPVRSPAEAGERLVTKGPRQGEVAKTQGSATERVPGELVGMVVRHTTARPTPEQSERGTPPDVHLHSHGFLLNMAWVPDENHPEGGKWRAIDDHNIKKLRQSLEHRVQGEFARLLEDRMGAKIDYSTDQAGTTRWRLAGIDPQACEFYSTRSRQIEAEKRDFEQRVGRPPTPSELRDIAREHRRPKESGWDHDRQPQWDAYAEGLRQAGLELPKLRFGPIQERAPLAEREEALRERLLASNGLCANDALFYRDTIAPTVARCAVGLGLSPTELEDFTQRFEASPDLTLERAVGSEPGRFDLLSTRVVKSAEALIVDTAVAKATTEAPAPTPEAVRAAIAASPVRLDDEQVRAVEAACRDNAWCTWNGWAGAGKTSALRAVVAAYRGAGGEEPVADHVFALSTAAMTAQETAKKIGGDQGLTIEGLAAKVDKDGLQLGAADVLIVDEYVMLDTFRAAELLRAAGEAQVVCVGDPLQLQGIGASGWQADVEEALAPRGLSAVELTNVHRQTDAADREMLAAERTGRAADALANLADRGRVHIAQTPQQADGQVIDAYKHLRDQGRAVTDLFVNTDTSNERVDTYNRLIQDDRLRRGEVGGAHLDYRSTNAGRHETLYAGDRVALVTGVEDRGQRVANGRKGTIVRIDEENRRAVVALDDGKAVRIDVAVSAPMVPIRLCYAGHACRLQGAEAPVVLVVPGNGSTSLESAYSSLSRGQEEIHVFADTTTHGPDPLAHLAERWAHPEPKRTATARARDAAEIATGATGVDPYTDLRPGGDEPALTGPMTGRQQAYLAHLAADAGEKPPKGLSKAEASRLITELQRRSGREVPEWAQQAAAELAELPTIATSERSPAPPPTLERAAGGDPGLEHETEVSTRHSPDRAKEPLPQSKLPPPTFDPDRNRGHGLDHHRALQRSRRPSPHGPASDA
jgi:conjugative relaxase-like TrwC/TraI family protein